MMEKRKKTDRERAERAEEALLGLYNSLVMLDGQDKRKNAIAKGLAQEVLVEAGFITVDPPH